MDTNWQLYRSNIEKKKPHLQALLLPDETAGLFQSKPWIIAYGSPRSSLRKWRCLGSAAAADVGRQLKRGGGSEVAP